nr:DUF6318 family protein [Actinotalea sp. Marseille-Q4924]
MVVSAGLAGCTGGSAAPEPTPSPPASAPATSPAPTPTAAAEPTPEPLTAPVRPPEMSQPDEAGAIAAAEYALLVAHYAVVSGDLTEWDRLATSDCGFCANIRQSVTDAYGPGGRLEGGAFTLGDGTVVATDPSMNIFAVDIPYANAAVNEYDSAGALVDTEPPGDGIFTLEVIPARGGWRLLGAAARGSDE